MDCKKQMRRLMCGVAMSAVAVAPLVAKADTMDTTTTSATTSTTTMDASTAPTAVTGSVVRYYVDQAGYVTAMDIQTANGVSMVRFSPSMGQRLYTMYPVSSQASVYVVGSPTGGWDVVGTGTTPPTTAMTPSAVSDVQLLSSEPYILAGSKMMTWSGSLSNIITDKQGEVVGLVLDDTNLVRVPREVRNMAPGDAGTSRVAGLFKGAKVMVTGYEEAPRYGVLSSFTHRIAANALTINGRAVGAIGIPMMNPTMTKSLFKFDIGGTAKSAEEMTAMGMGYTTYTPSGSTMMNGTGMDTTTNSTTTGAAPSTPTTQ